MDDRRLLDQMPKDEGMPKDEQERVGGGMSVQWNHHQDMMEPGMSVPMYDSGEWGQLAKEEKTPMATMNIEYSSNVEYPSMPYEYHGKKSRRVHGQIPPRKDFQRYKFPRKPSPPLLPHEKRILENVVKSIPQRRPSGIIKAAKKQKDADLLTLSDIKRMSEDKELATAAARDKFRQGSVYRYLAFTRFETLTKAIAQSEPQPDDSKPKVQRFKSCTIDYIPDEGEFPGPSRLYSNEEEREFESDDIVEKELLLRRELSRDSYPPTWTMQEIDEHQRNLVRELRKLKLMQAADGYVANFPLKQLFAWKETIELQRARINTRLKALDVCEEERDELLQEQQTLAENINRVNRSIDKKRKELDELEQLKRQMVEVDNYVDYEYQENGQLPACIMARKRAMDRGITFPTSDY